MTTTIDRRRLDLHLMRAASLCLLALTAVLLHPHEARAQWTTSGTNTTTPNAVGIGTTDPSQGNTVGARLTVATIDDNATAIATSNGTTPRFALNNHANGSWTMYDYSGNGWHEGITQQSGFVGIGTRSPQFLLDVAGSPSSPFRVRDSSGREYFSTGTRTGPYPTWTVPVVSLAGGRLIVDSTSADGGNETIVRRVVNSMIFYPSDHPDLPGGIAVRQKGGATVLWIDQNTNGEVGIGTKLNVAGDINVGGNINAKYQDVAEWVASTQKLAAGTVVVLDPKNNNHVLASQAAYDTKVAGVVSARPGIALGEGGAGKALVATTGRVKVRVDATRAPISIGDLIVTSDAEGVAMKSEPVNLGGVTIHRPGTIIGKALEPLASGTGEILVLLSLQ
jgi:hypothetical protein